MDREFVLRVLEWKKQGYELAKEAMPDQVQQCLSKVEEKVKDTAREIVMDGLLGHKDNAVTADNGDKRKDTKKKSYKVNIES